MKCFCKLAIPSLAMVVCTALLLAQAPDDEKAKAQAAAKASKTGLWDDKNAIAPWTFRGEKGELPVDTEPTPAAPKSVPVPGRAYILGPRGGCYYLNEQGIKVYVKDKTLCQKPQ